MMTLPSGKKVCHYQLTKAVRAVDMPEYMILTYGIIDCDDEALDAMPTEEFKKLQSPCKVLKVREMILGLN